MIHPSAIPLLLTPKVLELFEESIVGALIIAIPKRRSPDVQIRRDGNYGIRSRKPGQDGRFP